MFSSNRVPALGDLPLLGRLFSSQKDDYQRTELVLAITPRIVRPAPRADISQAELWVGSESSTRLRLPPPSSPRSSAAGTTTASVSTATNAASATNPAPLALGAPSAPAPAKPATDGPTRLQWKAPSEVKVGEGFAVSVNVNSGTALRGLPLEIAYPSNLLEVVAIAEGDFLKQGEGATSFVQANNQATGRLNIGLLRNDSTGASGEGTVVQIQFKAKAAGAIQLSFTSARPIGAEGAVNLAPLPTLDIVAK